MLNRLIDEIVGGTPRRGKRCIYSALLCATTTTISPMISRVRSGSLRSLVAHILVMTLGFIVSSVPLLVISLVVVREGISEIELVSFVGDWVDQGWRSRYLLVCSRVHLHDC